MFTLIDGYTALLSEDKQKAHQLLEKSREIIKPLIKECNGEWHKDTLSSFSSAIKKSFHTGSKCLIQRAAVIDCAECNRGAYAYNQIVFTDPGKQHDHKPDYHPV